MSTFCLMMVFGFLFFIYQGLEISSKTINVNLQGSKLLCVQDVFTSNQSAFFQHKLTKTMYKTLDGTVIISKSMFPSTTYKKIQCSGNQKIILLTQNNNIYLFDTVSEKIQSFDGSMITDVTYVKISQTYQKIVYISNFSEVRIKNALFSQSEEIYQLIGRFSQIICSTYRNKSLDGYCFLLAEDGTKIQYFNATSPEKMKEKKMVGLKVLRISEMNQKIYLGLQSGEIKEYSLKDGLMYYERSTNISKDHSILDLAVNELRNELIYLNSEFKTGIISLASGYQIGSTFSCRQYCTSLSKIIIFSENQFSFFTGSQLQTIQPFLKNDEIIKSSSLSQADDLMALCPNEQLYFDSTLEKCVRCQTGCSICDQQTAHCFACIEGYFMKNDKCLNCKFSDLNQKDYEFCLEETEISILSLSNSIAPILATGIQSTYSILSGSALLFLFIRFINFWSIVSIYYFLNVSTLPYFLLQFLSKIFTILYGSVFEYFGIDISQLNMGIEERNTNQKMKITQISTDFIKSNFQSIVTFIYSTFLICFLYDAIKKWFEKLRIHLFQKVKLEACLEEFMGIFVPLVVPLSYFLTNLTALNTQNIINNGLFLFFLGTGTIFPFIYLILIVNRITLKQRLDMIKNEIQQNLITSQKILVTSNKKVDVKSNDPKKQNQKVKNQLKTSLSYRQIFQKNDSESQKRGNKFTKNHVNFITQEEGQKFLYCLNAFWCPLLVSFQNPIYFLVFGLAINFICVCNAFYAKNWKISLICEKFILFSYHSCFVIMVIFPDTTFTASLIAIILIICGGAHELITAVVQKLYFFFLVLKNKKILRNNRIVQETTFSQNNTFKVADLSFQFQNEKQNQNSKTDSKISIQVPTFKQIDAKTSTIIDTKKSIKKTRFLEDNDTMQTKINEKISSAFFFDKINSIQSINFEKQTQKNKSHHKVIFQNLTNPHESKSQIGFPSQISQCNILTKNLNQEKVQIL